MKLFTIKNPKNLDIVAQKVLSEKKRPLILALCGDLGTGKTTFAKEIGLQLKINQPIISPTFIIHREYLIDDKSKIYLHHLDLYRLDDAFELDELDIRSLISNDNIIIIEWADKFKSYIQKFDKFGAKIIWMQFEHIDESTREITIL